MDDGPSVDSELQDLIDRLVVQGQREVDGLAPEDTDLALFRFHPEHSLRLALALPPDLPAQRHARAEVLSGVVNGASLPLEQAVAMLLTEVDTEQHPVVLSALAHAVGHTGDTRGRPALLRLARHDDDRVRLSAVQALPSLAREASDDELDPDAVAALVEASRDPVTRIRDWATFGLGSVQAVGPGVVEALIERTRDEDADTRAEALAALAQRRDERAVDLLLAELTETATTLVLRTAGWLADPRLHAALVVLTNEEPDNSDPWVQALVAAIARCDPRAAVEAERIEGELLATLIGTTMETGLGALDIVLDGAYPETDVVVTVGSNQVRSPIWNLDEQEPADPWSIDLPFTRYRLGNLARRL